MKTHTFNSKFELGPKMGQFSEDRVKAEPMFWSATPSFAWHNSEKFSPTRQFLALCMSWLNIWDLEEMSERFNFDSRVHMLMPGWFPAIPGWHHDDVPRSRSDGQPNYDNPEFKSQHILALVNGDICPTEFAVGKAIMPDIPLFSKHPIYKHWHEQVELDIKDNCLARVPVPSNQLIRFDWQAFHQATKATKRGWRWFGRLSWDAGYEQGRPHHNEIRRQVQVYLENPMEGW